MANLNSTHSLARVAVDTICNAIGDANPAIHQIGGSRLVEDVSDHTLKYLVTSSTGKKYVLIVSNTRFPQMVSRAVRRLEDAKSVLCPESHDVTELPIHHGTWEGVSYALWLYRIPLSTNRLHKSIQQFFLATKVRSWLSAVALQTQRNNLTSKELRSNFIEPLNALISNPKFSGNLNGASHNALKRLAGGDFKPVHVLQHGDLWFGNVLINGYLELFNPVKRGFTVIDWGGAKISGYPFFDLLIFSKSCNISPQMTARHINSMINIIRCERADVVVYVLCALGKLYQELEHFHEHRFIGLCEMTIEYLAQTGLSIESNLADSAPAGSTFSYRLPSG